MRKARQSTAKNVMVLMVDSADHITGKTGLTLTITASKDGAAFESVDPTVTERGNGWYAIALTASHTDALGDLALHITGAAADPADMVLLVEAGATDADVSTRLAAAGYTAPDNAGISSNGAAIAALPDAPGNAAATRSELAAELAAVLEVWRRHGLDIAAPLTQTTTAISAGAISLAVAEDVAGTVTVTRQP